MTEQKLGPWTVTGLAALVTGVALLLAGWWWAGAAVGLALGLISGRAGRVFWPVTGGVAAAWFVLALWQIVTNEALAAVGMVAAVAGLPPAAGAAFLVVPALLAALAGGLAGLAGAHLAS